MATNALDTQDFFSTTLSSQIVATDTTIFLNALPTPSEGYLVLESTNSSTREVIYYTSKGSNFVTCPSAALGRGLGGTTAQTHASGATVEMNMTSEHWKALKDGTAFSDGILGFSLLANNTEGQFGNNFVSSGLSVTGASSSLVATMISGTAYVAGKRVQPAVGGRTYQASSDTFVDLKSDATFTYAGGTSGNSGASVPLTASSIRVARVNTHATGINSITQDGSLDKAGNSLLGSGIGSFPKIIQSNFAIQGSNFSTGTAGFQDVTGASFSYTTGSSPETLFLWANAMFQVNSGTSVSAYVTISVNGVDLSPYMYLDSGGTTPVGLWQRQSQAYVANVPASTAITIKLRAQNASASGAIVVNVATAGFNPTIHGFAVRRAI